MNQEKFSPLFQESRADYETLPIPDALAGRVQEGIRQGRQARASRKKRLQRYGLRAAACFIALLAGLNLSPTIAHAAAQVPFLGGLFQVLTVVHYTGSENGIDYSLEVPLVDAEGDTAARVNQMIQAKMDQHLETARQDWAEYQEAFFATGGTEEEWAGRTMDVAIAYEIKSQSDTQVSFVVTMSESWVAAMEEQYCYNLDLAQDRTITLQDLLGEDWVNLCNTAIQQQIDASKDAEGFSYFFAPEEGGFITVDEGTAFYIREDGVPVVVFPRYAIAARPAGCPEFPIESNH